MSIQGVDANYQCVFVGHAEEPGQKHIRVPLRDLLVCWRSAILSLTYSESQLGPHKVTICD